MRARIILLLLVILLVAGFAAFNWDEVNRTSPLFFGAFVMDAPMGLILLCLLGGALLGWLVSEASWSTRHLVESRHHFKTLEAQRELADKAEASRFTDLRQHLDTQLRELRQRDAIAATEFEKNMVQGQRDMRAQLEQMNRMLTARLGELEARLDTRFERLGMAHPAPPTLRDPVGPDPRLAQDRMRDERLRDERMHEDRLRENERLREEALRAEGLPPHHRHPL